MGLAALIAKLGLDISGWRTGWTKAEGIAKKATGSIADITKSQLAGMFGAAAIGAAMKNTVEYASRVSDLSEELGISREQVQELTYAAEQNGATIDDFRTSIIKLGKARQEALNDPKGDAAKSFKEMKIAGDDLKKLNLWDVLLKIGDEFNSLANPQQKAASVLNLLGKSSNKIFTTMRNDLRGTIKEANEFNQIMGDDAVIALEALGDQISILAGSIRTELGGAMVNAMSSIMESVNWLLKKIGFLSTYLGNRVGGASFDDAIKAGAQYEMDADYRSGEITAARAKRRADKASRDAAMQGFVGSYESQKTGGVSNYKNNVTAWQQIGAYAPVNPMLSEQQISNKHLSDIKRAISAAEKNRKIAYDQSNCSPSDSFFK